jgi:hypothetical protein
MSDSIVGIIAITGIVAIVAIVFGKSFRTRITGGLFALEIERKAEQGPNDPREETGVHRTRPL